MAIEFNDDNFQQEVIEADVPVLVDFWATWCGPCKIIGPIVEELAADNEGKAVKVGKMDVDANDATPGQYGVMSIPTLIVFKDGKPFKQMVGVQTKEVLQAALDEAMA